MTGKVLARSPAAGAGGGPALVEVIEEIVLGAPTAAIDFAAIPSTYRHLRLVLTGRGDTAAAQVNLALTFNGDSGTNYSRQSIQGAATSITTSGGTGLTSLPAGSLPAASAPADASGLISVDILDYAGTAFWKNLLGDTGYPISTTTSGKRFTQIWGQWESTAAINQITLTASADNLVAGSVATLYGTKGA